MEADKRPKLQPTRNRVLLARLSAKDRTPGGLHVPETAQERSARCLVVAVGPGKHEHGVFVEPTVRAGDEVIVGKYAGAEVEEDGKLYVVVQEDEILAVLAAPIEPGAAALAALATAERVAKHDGAAVLFIDAVTGYRVEPFKSGRALLAGAPR